jgi:transposase InsO family protein
MTTAGSASPPGLVERATSRAVCQVLMASLARYGIPDEILTDNGKCFTGRFGPQPVEVAFDRICRENGISHRLTAPRSPTTTGKIERFHQSLRREFLADRALVRAFVHVADARTSVMPRSAHLAANTVARAGAG